MPTSQRRRRSRRAHTPPHSLSTHDETPVARAALSLRELSKARTRDAIIDASLACFSEEGLDEPSLDAICARAGCTRGAFYVHFRDRDDLIVAAMDRRRDTALAAFFEKGTAPIADVIEIFANAVEHGQFPSKGKVRTPEFLAACRRSETIREAQLELMHRTLKKLQNRVRRDQKDHRVRRDLDAGALATLMLLLEAGVELVQDLGFRVDMPRCARALRAMIEPA